MRRFDEPVRRHIRYRERQGAYGIVFLERRLLITRQTEPVPEFQLPGGGIDHGEGPLQALRREIMEETGWTVVPLRFFAAYRRFVYMPEYQIWARKTHRTYLCAALRRTGPPRESFHSAHWMTASRAGRVLGSAGDRHVLRQALACCPELSACVAERSEKT